MAKVSYCYTDFCCHPGADKPVTPGSWLSGHSDNLGGWGDKGGSIGFFENEELAGGSGEKFWVTAPDKGTLQAAWRARGVLDNRVAGGYYPNQGRWRMIIA